MLICPQCQSENPNDNKFCQECGLSFSRKDCSSCGTAVMFDVLHCPNCEAETGIVWKALFAGRPSLDALDPSCILRQRYQILEQAVDSPAERRVLDLFPLQKPLLDRSAPPAIARPYLALYQDFPQVLPPVHDAWQEEAAEFILIEDRSKLPLLVDYLTTTPFVPMLQILHWFYEMLDLWEALAPWNLQQSLLELDNLRLDEDQILCLRRLHPDSASATLKNLSTIWQTLLDKLQQTQSAALHTLLAELQTSSDVSIDTVRSQLKAIAQEIPDPAPLNEMMSDPEFFSSDAAPMSSTEDITIVADDDEDSDGEDMPTVVLPMQLFSLEDAGRTDIGRQREHNEDCFGIDTEITKHQLLNGRTVRARGLYVLCDGMGGHASGEVASQLAVETLRKFFQRYWQDGTNQLPSAQVIREAVQLANQVIYDQNQASDRSGSGRMGTTMVMLLVHDTEAAVAHVGDSRLYRYTRKRGLEQLTLDHEVGQREILRGVEPEVAYGRPDAYQLTQALGPRGEQFIHPDIRFFELNEDAVLILASDGLTDNNLLEAYWQTHVDPLVSSSTNLDTGVSKLIELANQQNGHDNITAIAVRVKVRPNLEQLR